MKILLLIVSTVWSFSNPVFPPAVQIVTTVEEAAIVVWQKEDSKKLLTEPDRDQYKLIEINIDTGEIKTLSIPKICFSEKEKK